jgi:hypothetical protein
MQVRARLLVAVVEQRHRGHNAAVPVEDLKPENSRITARAHTILLIAAWCREKINVTLMSWTCHVDGTLEMPLQ